MTFVMAVLLAGEAQAGGYDLKGARVYSNVCYNVEGGDLLGAEVIVRPAGTQPRLLFRRVEGDLGDPVPARGDVIGSRVRFSIIEDGGEIHFEGRLNGARMSGYLDGPRHERLRLKLHAGRYANCR
jgi:hypothetical protein